MENIVIKEKQFLLPTFFPDATRGVARSIDSHDLEKASVEGLVVNTYHLMTQPGSRILKQAEGIKKFMHWDRWIISDSGGFQLLSMIYQDKSFGSINANGVIFYKGEKREKYLFTPEKSIQMQFTIGSDIMICLDDCPRLDANDEENKLSVDRTIEWAKRCKAEYEKQLEQRKMTKDQRPLLFGVIQGGNDKAQRERCAIELQKIGFDGYGFGGWPLDKQGILNAEILSYTASLIPHNFPKYALGVGNPQAVVDSYHMGWNIFDCVLPTRDARHQRLYVFRKDPAAIDIHTEKQIYEFVHIMKEEYVKDESPISQYCDCYTCENYSKAYLHHLFTIKDVLAMRLATIHNVRMYTMLIQLLREFQ